MENLAKYLSQIEVNLDQLLLDPNNPRFAELGEEFNVVPENRYDEDKIQRQAYEKMKHQRFDVNELRDTIKTIGFLPMDKLVVRKWKFSKEGDDKYVLIEGNRRVTSLKWLIDLHDSGKETFTPEQLDNFKNLKVLLLDDASAPETAKWILPGLRHVSGIKEWGPYQKARAVYALRESGWDPQEAAQSLGLSTRAANQLWRSYLALEQMKLDEEYGEFAEPNKYSYFEELFKRPNVRNKLQWDDLEKKFKNEEFLREFYSWMVGEIQENGEPADPKLPEAKSIRDLSKIFDDKAAMSVFRGPEGTLTRALAKYEVEHPEDWRPVVTGAELVLAGLTPDTLRMFTTEDVSTLNKLSERITSVLSDHAKLTQV